MPGENGEGFPLSLKEKIVSRLFLGKPNPEIQNNPEYQAAIPELKRVHDQAWVWHGTGRYQYDPPSYENIRDVLQTIAVNGGLVPHRDPMDVVQGEMYSISTALSPSYAELYAELHFPKGKRLRNHAVDDNEGGKLKNFVGRLRGTQKSASLWSYYLLGIAFQGVRNKEEARIFLRQYFEGKKQKKKDPNHVSSYQYFHDKYSKQPVSIPDMVRGGNSDIEGNYPILIGIKKGAFEPRETTELIKRHELRSPTAILITDFTHLEVPQQQVPEVKKVLEDNADLLRNNGLSQPDLLPVIPMEWGEEYRKTLPPSYVIDGKPFSS